MFVDDSFTSLFGLFDSFSLLVLWLFSIIYWKNKDKWACGVMDYG
jgi:hypothetical protein